LSSVDMEEIVKIGGKIIRIYEGVIFTSHYEESPFKKFVEHLFELRLKYKKESNDIMQNLVKLMLNSLYGKTIQKDINKEVHIWSEETLREKFDERIVDYSRLPCGKYIVELKEEEGVDVEEVKKGLNPSHLGIFILSYSKRIMNRFIKVIDGFYNPVIYYTDTDSLYIHKNNWDKLDKAGLVGGKLGQGKNDYDTGGIFYSLFLGSKIKYCLTIDADGNIEAHSTFKGFNKEGLSFENYLEIEKGNNINTSQPLKWKRSFEDGVIFRDKIDKEFNAACNINKRAAADIFGVMKPYHNITEVLFEEYKKVMKVYYKVKVSDDYEDFLNEYPNIIDI
jgi:DNA polymerase type B, organellar and viral